MYGIPDNLNRQRYRHAITEFCDTLSGMVLLPQLVLPSTSKSQQNSSPTLAGIEQGAFDNKEMKSAANMILSSASTPSLRSRDGTIPPHMMRMDVGGNVRVVVRVRAFLPRGKFGFCLAFVWSGRVGTDSHELGLSTITNTGGQQQRLIVVPNA